MNDFFLNEREILVFGLALIRVSSFLMSWPVFSQISVPNPTKVLLSVVVTFCVFSTIPREGVPTAALESSLIWLSGRELLIGLLMGFSSRMLFYAIEVGGHIVATSIGFANATVFNPASGASSTVLERFYLALLSLLLLALNVHHFFLSTLVESFHAVPIQTLGIDLAALNAEGGSGLMLQTVMISGLQIAAPVMVLIFTLNIVMGIVGRAVPQINVLITSIPVNILAGLAVLIMTLPALIVSLDKDMVQYTEMLMKFMRSL